MPLHKCKMPDGSLCWQWGLSGKKYKKKLDALKQMKAIFANGYRLHKTASLSTILLSAKQYYPDSGSHGWNHIQDVLNTYKRLKGSLLTDDEKLAVYYHDSGMRDIGRQGHNISSAGVLIKDYADKIPPDRLIAIASAIIQHRKSDSNQYDRSPMSNLLYYADKGTPQPNADAQLLRMIRYRLLGNLNLLDKTGAQPKYFDPNMDLNLMALGLLKSDKWIRRKPGGDDIYSKTFDKLLKAQYDDVLNMTKLRIIQMIRKLRGNKL